jgi:hypothetical protein
MQAGAVCDVKNSNTKYFKLKIIGHRLVLQKLPINRKI